VHAERRASIRALLVSLATLASGCPTQQTTPDAAIDSPLDGSLDVSLDVRPDVPLDVARADGLDGSIDAIDGTVTDAFDSGPPSYTISTSPPGVHWIDACAAAGSTMWLSYVGDGTAPAQTVPFAFTFFGQTYASVQPSADGYVVIGSDVRVAAVGTYPLPDPPAPHPALFVYGHDLMQRAAGVCVAVVGSAPNRQYVIETNDAAHYLDGASSLTFEAIITEGTNTIDFVYDTLSGIGTTGESCVVGIQDENGLVASMYEFMTAGSLHNGLAIRFTPSS
jgi:hypothetical protein